MNKNKNLVLIGFLGVVAVALGAFGAHGLKALLTPAEMNTFETGIHYHFYHTFAILAAAILTKNRASKPLNIAIILFSVGILLFSGSLYLLACREILGIESWTFLGPITPLGGVCFIGGWAMFIVKGLKN
jgi:uncharacterized membrane protein YgdD (TMEM256/DUF423 family)